MGEFDIKAFRVAFSEFNDTAKYPDELIEFWSGLGELLVRPSIWKKAWQQGMSLYVAHHIVLARRHQKEAKFGKAPAMSDGVLSNKTVGGVTIGYDSNASNEEKAGQWNLTTYGKQFYQLVRIFGAGCIQL